MEEAAGVDGSVGGDLIAGPGEASGPRVSEEVVWKDRALDAEREVEALRERVGELESELERVRGELRDSSRRAEIDRLLRDAGATDPETARAVVESMSPGDGPGELAAAVSRLRRDKPFLFETGGVRSSTAGVAAGGVDAVRAAEEEARHTGDRRALLRYLRVRRGLG